MKTCMYTTQGKIICKVNQGNQVYESFTSSVNERPNESQCSSIQNDIIAMKQKDKSCSLSKMVTIGKNCEFGLSCQYQPPDSNKCPDITDKILGIKQVNKACSIKKMDSKESGCEFDLECRF